MNELYMCILVATQFPWMIHTLYIALNSPAIVGVEDFEIQLSITRYATTYVLVVTRLSVPRTSM
jgi:hypothetical protein